MRLSAVALLLVAGCAATPSPASVAFAHGVDALGHGDYATADASLAAFEHAFPDDARAEDAAWMRTVARLRLRDRDGAVELARAYLAAHPNGLRRPEATRIVERASR